MGFMNKIGTYYRAGSNQTQVGYILQQPEAGVFCQGGWRNGGSRNLVVASQNLTHNILFFEIRKSRMARVSGSTY
jgi:hypothetical protein